MSATKLTEVPERWVHRGPYAWWLHVAHCESCSKHYEIPADVRKLLRLGPRDD